MANARFLRENAALLIGLALPLLVVALFLIVSRGPGLLVAPPAHDLLLRVEGARQTDLPYRIDLAVIGERLRARAFRVERSDAMPGFALAQPLPRLFVWEHQRQTLREIEIALPANLEALPDGAEIELSGVSGRRVVTTLVAPDGYELRSAGNGAGVGVFGLFFGRGERRIVLAKDGARVAIPLPEGLQYWSFELVGWLVD